MHYLKSLTLIFAITYLVSWSSGQKCNVMNDQLNCVGFEDIKTFSNDVQVNSISVSISDEKAVYICDSSIFQKLDATRALCLENCGILLIEKECFMGLLAVQTINLSKNKLTNLDMQVFPTTELTELDLSDNFLVNMQFEEIVIPELSLLNARNNRIKNIKISSKNLPKIQNLQLSSNLIDHISIESNTLIELDISYNRIKILSAEDFIIPKLQVLWMTDNHLQEINAEILKNVPSLKRMFFGHNMIRSLSFPYLKDVTLLDLTYSRIKDLNNIDFSSLEGEYALHLAGNKLYEIEAFPDTVSTNVTQFSCPTCSIHLIEPTFFGKAFKRVRAIHLDTNHLESSTLFEANEPFTQLIVLDLRYNKIMKIEKNDFLQLTEVKYLLLNHNKITSVADHAFDKQIKLEKLDMSYNLLFIFHPTLFDNIIALTDLNLNANNMPYFPIPGWNKELNEANTTIDHPLNKLKILGLYNNPLLCKCYDALSKWIRQHMNIFLVENKKTVEGKAPVCIVLKDQECNEQIQRDFSIQYLSLFNPYN